VSIANKTTVAYFPPAARRTVTAEIYQYAIGQVLQIEGLDLPQTFHVDFSNYETKSSSKPSTGSDAAVSIPGEYLRTGLPVYAFIVLSEGTDDSATEYVVQIPVRRRPQPTDIAPDPEEQSVIDELIAELNDGVASAEQAAAAAEESEEASGSHAQDAEAWAVGQRNGEDVDQTDETYHNNSKYWSEEAERKGSEKATLAESWAVGGTGTRQDEDNDNAKHYSEIAAMGAEESGYAWFDVHDDDGHMYVYISDNLSEDVSFAVNEATGHLEVTYK